MKRAGLLSAVVAVFVLSSVCLTAQDPPPGTATGKKIGTIVKTAIDTALPGVTTLIEAIWGPRKADDKIKKDELAKAVDAAKKQLQDEFTKKAQTNLRPVQQVSAELQVLRQVLQPSVFAQEQILQMQTRLASGSLDANAQAQQEADWKVAKAQLDKLKVIKQQDLDNIRDLWLRHMVSRIVELNNDQVLRVDPKATGPAALNALQGVSLALRDVTAAVGYELAALESDIGELAKWANNAQGGNPVSHSGEFANLLTRRYPSRQRK